jgi:hypothetical protein
LEKKLYTYSGWLGILLFILNGTASNAQVLGDSLRLRLSESDRDKFSRVSEFIAKGDALLAGTQLPSISEIQADTVISDIADIEHLVNYKSRLDASLWYKRAIKLEFNILNANIQAFWEKNAQSKKELKLVSLIESAAFDSILLADEWRAEADRLKYGALKIPLLDKAEKLERKALLDWEKVLYCYLSWPGKPDIPWLLSDDTGLPDPQDSLSPVTLNSQVFIQDLAQKELAPTSIYSLMQIGEQQVDLFNDFLMKEYPAGLEEIVVGYRGLQEAKIDSLRDEWNQFRYAKYGNADMPLPLLTANRNADIPVTFMTEAVAENTSHHTDKTLSREVKIPTNAGDAKGQKPLFNEKKSTDEFVFRVQIAASRSRMSRRELHRIYNGRLSIAESFEDNWYKYTIGLYSSHAEACRLRDQTSVKGVFVASYLNGKRIKVSPLQKMQFYSDNE